MSDLIGAKALSKRIDLHPRTLRKMAKKGEIPYVKLPNNMYLFDPEDVINHLKNQKDKG